MSGFANSEEQAALNHFFGKSNWAQRTIYVGLSTTAPSDDGTNVTEPSGNGYARKQTSSADWSSASGSAPAVTSNNSTITFNEATGSWGTITHFVFYSSSSSGTFLGSGALNSPKAVGSGDTPRFPVGSLQFKLGDPGDTY